MTSIDYNSLTIEQIDDLISLNEASYSKLGDQAPLTPESQRYARRLERDRHDLQSARIIKGSTVRLTDDDGAVEKTPSRKSQSLKGAKAEMVNVLQQVQASKIKLQFVDGKTGDLFSMNSESLLQDALNSCHALSPESFKNLTQNVCADSILPPAVQQLSVKLKDLLNSNSEVVCQQELHKLSVELDAVDSSNGSIGQFLHSKSLDGVECIYPLTAKADLIGKNAPLSLEIKAQALAFGDDLVVKCYEVLAQLIWRVFTIRNTAAYYGCYIGMACSPRSAWMVQFTRDESKFGNKEEFETITVRRILHVHVLPLWLSYTAYTRRQPHWYFTDTAPYLLNTLSRITDPYCCCVKLHAVSSWFVYRVSLPAVYTDTDPNGRKRRVLGAVGDRPNFMVKVVLDRVEYEREAAAVKEVSEEYNLTEPAFHYALGVCALRVSAPTAADTLAVDLGLASLTDNASERWLLPATPPRSAVEPLPQRQVVAANSAHDFALRIASKDGFQFIQLDEQPLVSLTPHPCAWRNITDAYLCSLVTRTGSQGGCIVMRVGRVVAPLPTHIPERDQERQIWLQGVSRCLYATHRAKWRHCDIRPANVLIFGDTYMLIDYSLAAREGETVLLLEGDRYDHLGYGLRGLPLGTAHKWTEVDDLDMAAATMLRLP